MEEAYWLRRQREELSLAGTTTCAAAKVIHLDMARRYSVKADKDTWISGILRSLVSVKHDWEIIVNRVLNDGTYKIPTNNSIPILNAKSKILPKDYLRKLIFFGLLVLVSLGVSSPAWAVPAFAAQVGQPCQSCHVGGFGPQLTSFGREFKLGGYTLRSGKTNIPVSAMAVAAFTHAISSFPTTPGGPPTKQDSVDFEQGSIFLAGGIGSHLGGFIQTTYDGIGKTWSWDNVDLRVVNTGQIGGKSLTYGISLNNSPTTQDVWNTLPAWGYPYTSSAVAPGPATSPLIAGGLAQNVIGVTAYAWIDSKLYVEAGGYSSPKAGTLRWLGVDPFDPGDLRGVAPYGRMAYQRDVGGGTAEIGVFGMKAALYPGRDRSTGATDRYTDVGVDASWIKQLGSDTLTLNARYTHEKRSLDASCTSALAGISMAATAIRRCAHATLSDFHGDASYYWHNKIGATIGVFDLSGSANADLYPDSRTARPNSSGVMLQLDGTPFGNGNSPFGARFNIRTGVQYTAYTRFDGARHNYDGAGSNASDNNTLSVFTWVAF